MNRRAVIKKIKSSFSCQQCNECCKQPGFVYLTKKDMKRLAQYFKMDQNQFVATHCKREGEDWVLRVNPDESCVFLTDSGCSIYEARPNQCRDFPRKWRDKECFTYCAGIRALAAEKDEVSA
jgi:uncharacterized protein